MNFLISLLSAAIAKIAIKPVTKASSYVLTHAEGTEHGTAAAQALAP